MAHTTRTSSLHQAPETVPHWDAPELYIPPNNDKYPGTSVYQCSGGNSPMSIHHHDTGLESACTTTTKGDTEKGETPAKSKQKWWQRRVHGGPLHWMLVILAVVVIGGTVGGIVASLSSPKDAILGPVATNTTTNTTTNSTSPLSNDDIAQSNPIQPPWQDKWYYIKNSLLNPTSDTVVKISPTTENMTIGYLSQSTGDPYEHWGFNPVSSTKLPAFKSKNNITTPVYLVYNRAFDNKAEAENEQNWWWMERHPDRKFVYIKSGYWGTEKVLTVIRTGYKFAQEEEQKERIEMTFTKAGDEQFLNGQAWRLEVAASFGED